MKALLTLLSFWTLALYGPASVSAQTREADASMRPPVRISWQTAVDEVAQRRLEVFAQVGRMEASDSSGSLGTIAPIGGSIRLVRLDGLVLEADFQTGHVTRTSKDTGTTWMWRRSQVGGSLLRQQLLFDPVTVFFGGGVGLQLERISRDGQVMEEYSGLAGHGRGGLIIDLPGRWLLRSELGLWLVPDQPYFTMGVRIGAGVRL